MEENPRPQPSKEDEPQRTDEPQNTIEHPSSGHAPSHAPAHDRTTDNEPLETIAQAGQPVESQPQPGRGGLPASVPGYEILEELGRGGMGVVYKARQSALNRIVALKMILAGGHASAESHRRFMREAESAARLQHPNIVRVYDLGEQNGQTFFAMEYIEGTDLQKIGSMPPREAAQLLAKLAAAVDYAHGKGIVHRDLKPANVLLGEDGDPRITDFGLAKLLDGDEQQSLTGQDQLLGTAPYMPPEQARGESKNVGPPADVYALGAILYHLLTGQAPFIGRSTYEILKKVENDEAWSPDRLSAEVPRDLCTICLKCLEKNPERRYATAQAMADDLERFLIGDVIHASSIGPVSKTVRYVRRKTWAQVTMLAVVVVATVIGSRIWHDFQYVWPSESYFTNVDVRFGVAEGIAPLDKNVANHRSINYKIERRGRQGEVHSVTAVNSAGELTPSEALVSYFENSSFSSSVNSKHIAHMEFHRGTEGELLQVVAFDRRMEKQWSFQITDPPFNGQYLGPDGYQRAGKGSGAAHVESKFLEDGRLSEARFFDRRQRPQTDAYGVFGYAIEYDEENLQRQLFYLDASGEKTVLKGIASIRSTYDESGNLVLQEFLDEDEQRTRRSDGAAQERSEYDEFGNLVSVAALDAQGKMTMSSIGAAKVVYKYDSRGFISSRQYFGADDKLAPTVDGLAEVRYERNSMGQITRESYFDAEGMPVNRTTGYATRLAKYNSRGNIIERSALDVNGNPTVYDSGVCIIRYSYDEDDNVSERAFYDADRNPTGNANGVHLITAEYDQSDLVAERYFDLSGEPSFNQQGYAGMLKEYDDRGNVIKTTYVDGNDSPIETVTGAAIEEFELDENGLEIAQSNFDAEGRPTLNIDGWHRVEMTLDDRGNEVERQHFDNSGAPAWHKDGYVGIEYEFNQFDLVTSMTYLNAEGKPTTGAEGYAQQKAIYDRFGNQTETWYYDPDGNPTFDSEHGASRITMEFNERGISVASAWFDADGAPVLGNQGIARLEYDRDDHGNSIEQRTYDERGRPVAMTDETGELLSSPMMRFEFDSYGNTIAKTHFDADGNPQAGPDGFHKQSFAYDARGNQIEIRHFDVKGKPTEHALGYSWFEKRYDSIGNLAEIRNYDTENRLTVSNNGFAIKTFEHDRWSNLTAVSYFDADEQPVLTKYGIHRAESEFERNQLIRESFFGIDGKLKITSDGFAAYEQKFDSRGNRLEYRTFDENNELLEISGSAMERQTFNARNLAVTIEYFDRTKQPVRNSNNVASSRNTYDVRGNQVKYEAFDEEGKPTLESPWGLSSWTAAYNEKNTLVHQRFFGIDGKPVVSAELGYAEFVDRYDAAGNLMGRNYFDDQGEPLNLSVVITMVLPSSPASEAGLQVGDVVCRYEGQLVTDMRALVYSRKNGKPGNHVMEVERDEDRVSIDLPPGMLGVMFDDDFSAEHHDEEDMGEDVIEDVDEELEDGENADSEGS